MNSKSEHRAFMEEALAEAREGFEEGGIPIGAVLVIDGAVVGRGRNRRMQDDDPILHAEMDCLRRAGRLTGADYRRSTIYSTLSPCWMCTGAILLFGIPRVVMAEHRSFVGAEEPMRRHGVELIDLDLEEPRLLMERFIAAHAQVWAEDIAR